MSINASTAMRTRLEIFIRDNKDRRDQHQAGRAVVAHYGSLADLGARVNTDPFVEQHSVRVKIEQRIEFLLG